MINWYIEITDSAPIAYKTESNKKDEFIKSVIDTATPYMNHFCKKLSEISDWRLEDANNIFKEIVEEFPIMKAEIWKDEFRIRYNRYTYIKLTDTTKQIYRESKLNRILA
jgi:inhibitor of KinA sporulation pathway (predicted exonuclease)